MNDSQKTENRVEMEKTMSEYWTHPKEGWDD